MVLLHGIGGELFVWEPVLDASGRAPGRDRRGPARLRPLAAAARRGGAHARGARAAVAGLMDELGIAAPTSPGNSLGGWLALELGKTERARR